MENQKAQQNPLTLITNMMNMQTRMFLNAIEGLDEAANQRPNEQTNHMAWLAGHLVSTRYLMLGMLGKPQAEPHPELFAQGKSISNDLDYPSIAQSRKDWEAVSAPLAEALNNVSQDILNGKAPFPTPMGDSIPDAVVFFIHHEAYHIGQIGILRKILGKEAFKYG